MHHLFQHKLASYLSRTALAVALAAGCGTATAGTVHVAIDTSHFGVTDGYLDMNLSAALGVPLETATVSNLAGFDSNPFIDSWGVAFGPGTYGFRNDTANDLFQSVHFGGVLSFDLRFAGMADPLTSYVSHFVVSAFGADGFTALGNYDPVTGALADFSWTPSLNGRTEGDLDFVLSDEDVSVVPEPSAGLLLGAGFGALALVARRRKPRLSMG